MTINNVLRTALRIVGDRYDITDLDVEVSRVYQMIAETIDEEFFRDALARVDLSEIEGEAKPNAQVEGFSYAPFFEP